MARLWSLYWWHPSSVSLLIKRGDSVHSGEGLPTGGWQWPHYPITSRPAINYQGTGRGREDATRLHQGWLGTTAVTINHFRSYQPELMQALSSNQGNFVFCVSVILMFQKGSDHADNIHSVVLLSQTSYCVPTTWPSWYQTKYSLVQPPHPHIAILFVDFNSKYICLLILTSYMYRWLLLQTSQALLKGH